MADIILLYEMFIVGKVPFGFSKQQRSNFAFVLKMCQAKTYSTSRIKQKLLGPKGFNELFQY